MRETVLARRTGITRKVVTEKAYSDQIDVHVY
jgi:hypothetical protein